MHIEKASTFVLQQMQPINGLSYRPPIYLHSIFEILLFEILSLMNLNFSRFKTWILRTTSGRKIHYQLGKKSSYETRYFKLENCKNQVQIDRGIGYLEAGTQILCFVSHAPFCLFAAFASTNYTHSEPFCQKTCKNCFKLKS